MIICDCCGKNEAKVKDYRSQKNYDMDFLVCYECLFISDHSFWCKMARTDKKRG